MDGLGGRHSGLELIDAFILIGQNCLDANKLKSSFSLRMDTFFARAFLLAGGGLFPGDPSTTW